MVATATMTADGRWTAEVLEVAAGIARVQGIPHVDAIDIARRRVARLRGVPIERVAAPRRHARIKVWLCLADHEPVGVWVRG